jgi:hypothetical protein
MTEMCEKADICAILGTILENACENDRIEVDMTFDTFGAATGLNVVIEPLGEPEVPPQLVPVWPVYGDGVTCECEGALK